MVECTYDRRADAIYIRLASAPYSHGKDLDPERRVDYDSVGSPIGVELLCASSGVKIEGLPEASRVAEILRTHRVKLLP